MTTDDLPGYVIRAVLGEVVVSLARSINPFKEGTKSLRGGKSDPQGPEKLTKYRLEAITKLGEAASKKGANAVLGMRFDCRQVGPTHIEVCAYGTAAVVLQARPEFQDSPPQGHPPKDPDSTSDPGLSAGGGSGSSGP